MTHAEIVRLYHGEGLPLREVARRAGLSAERVRQVLEASGAGTRKRGREGLMANTQPTSLRLSAEAARMLAELESWLGLRRSALMELAVRKLHQAEAVARGSTAPPPPEKPKKGRPGGRKGK